MQVSNHNTEVYYHLLDNLFEHKAEKNKSDISYELIDWTCDFENAGIIKGTNEQYLQDEFDWYLSQDLCIKGHHGIETNKVWSRIADRYGLVNSNYGWCIFSPKNGSQFEEVVRILKNDKYSKQATMIYSRPDIHQTAGKDMICTIYTDDLIRGGRLIHIVHMRSNDVLFGLRNDLVWQQYVQQRLYNALKPKYKDLMFGKILWHADSLHCYKNQVERLKKYKQELEEYLYL